MKKNIVIVGVFSNEWSTNVFMANAFENIGFNVFRFDFRAFPKHEIPKMLIDFINSINDVFLIVFCKVDSVPIKTLKDLTGIIPTWYWFMDPMTVANTINAAERARACTYASSTSYKVTEYFKNFNKNSYRIIEGVDTTLYRNLGLKKEYDVLFVGTPDQKRLNYLLNVPYNVKIFGNYWPQCKHETNPPIYNEDLVLAINKSKIILNFTRPDGYSDRVTQILACGGFVLTEYADDLFMDFGDSLTYFTNVNELNQAIGYFLKAPTIRSNYIRKYYRKNLKPLIQTWEKTCDEIIQRVKENDEPI